MPRTRRSFLEWLFFITVLAGIFVGTYWFFHGYFILREHPGSLRFMTELAPGTGVLLLVLLARRYPLPYGTGLLLLGAWAVAWPETSGSWGLRLGFGLPLIGVGLAFILLRQQVAHVSEIRHG
jgi:hypothetical protein